MASSLNAGLEDTNSNSENEDIYPHPMNFKGPNCVSTKLDYTHFLFWEMEVLNMVETHGFTRFLDGNIPPPPKTKYISLSDGSISIVPNLLYKSWKKSDRLLKGWITSTLSNEVIGFVLHSETSADVWTALHESIKLSGEDRELMLQEELQTIR